MDNQPDLVVIGGGTGGYVAAIRAAQLGMSVVVAERDKLGGTCLHRGCIPSKALLRSAEVLAITRQAGQFGVTVSEPLFDLPSALARKQTVVDQLHKGVQHLMKKHDIRVLKGTARLMGPSIFSPQAGAVSVETEEGTEIVSPRFTLLASGSRPASIPMLPADGTRILTSDDALELSNLPSSAIIVGGGAIGVEWASMWNDFGVDVTIVEALPRLVPGEDEEISRELERLFKKRGIRVLTGTSILPETYSATSSGVQISARIRGDEEAVMKADVILIAVGRTPNSDDLGLSATEIVVDKGRVVVDEHYRTKEENIFAIGDLIGGMMLAHVAAHEGIHAVETMAMQKPRPIDYRLIPRCTYTRPEVAGVGLTEQQAREQGKQVKTGKFQFRASGKALVSGEYDGFVKIVADALTDDILGVHMIGPHVTDLVSEAGLAMVLDATPWEMGQTIHPHPTLSEALGEAALGVDGLAIHG